MMTLDPRAFSFALQQISDGFLFERLAQDIIACIIGREFRPMGGIKDKGMDGLEYCLEPEGQQFTIYQMSIEKDPESKVRRTLTTLKKNGLNYKRLFYVTNQVVKNQIQLEEALFNEFDVVTAFRDINWLRAQVQASESAIRVYQTFVELHLHEFAAKPSEDYLIRDFANDPRVYVFIRQQWEEAKGRQELENVVIDSLILLALEGTDPDKHILRSRTEIKERIHSILPQARILDSQLNFRLWDMSRKTNRRIRHHRKEDLFCLPFETRIQLEQKNLEDRALHDGFFQCAIVRLTSKLDDSGVTIRGIDSLMKKVIKECFHRQGLQFSEFVARAETDTSSDLDLSGLISKVVDEGGVPPKFVQLAKQALLETIREIVYQGNEIEKAFLKRMSDTYMMMFLTQGDPHTASFFATLAGKLDVLVDNSILIPALSELPLDSKNRRYWNLLVSAHAAGVKLFINHVTLEELTGHLHRIVDLYEDEYLPNEQAYATPEGIRYVDQILARSYLYMVMRNENNGGFKSFIENFVTLDSPHAQEELIEFLKAEFGIQYIGDRNIDVEIDKNDLDELIESLAELKKNKNRARNDAHTMLTIYALRQRNNELGQGGVFGYRTWWLSQDTFTYNMIKKKFGRKYQPSCYLRPDFLYNFVSLAPSVQQAGEVFDNLFPTLVGIQISHHVDKNIAEQVRQTLKKYQELPTARKLAVLRKVTEDLKTQPDVNYIHQLRSYFENESGSMRQPQKRVSAKGQEKPEAKSKRVARKARYR